MRKISMDENVKSAECILVYSPPNYGKTDSALTLDGKTYLVNFEEKNPMAVLKRDMERAKNITVFDDFRDFDEIQSTFDSWCEEARNGKLEADNIFIDGTSFQQSKFKTYFEDEHYIKKTEKKQQVYLFDRFSMSDDSMQGWGGLASLMKRITMIANRISKYGKTVIFTAWEVESPKYQGQGGVNVDYGPFFQGKEYSLLLSGYFSLIGRIVVPWKLDSETGKINPPIISFVQDDEFGSYLCRATGKLAPKGRRVPLNWSKIIGFLNKEENK